MPFLATIQNILVQMKSKSWTNYWFLRNSSNCVNAGAQPALSSSIQGHKANEAVLLAHCTDYHPLSLFYPSFVLPHYSHRLSTIWMWDREKSRVLLSGLNDSPAFRLMSSSVMGGLRRPDVEMTLTLCQEWNCWGQKRKGLKTWKCVKNWP